MVLVDHPHTVLNNRNAKSSTTASPTTPQKHGGAWTQRHLLTATLVRLHWPVLLVQLLWCVGEMLVRYVWRCAASTTTYT